MKNLNPNHKNRARQHKTCLNCGQKTVNNFCSVCGQKTNTHRITIKHFFMHDLLHGTFHIERGILFTAKEALLRPGKAALDYIVGKRVKYYNVFYLILILIGINILLGGGLNEMVANQSQDKEGDKMFSEILGKYTKQIIFAFVPIFAVNSFLIFRRKKLNFAELLVVAGMIFLGMMIISIMGGVVLYFDDYKPLETLWRIMYLIVSLGSFMFMLFGYRNAFREDYTALGYFWRISLFVLLYALETIILLITLLMFSYDLNLRDFKGFKI
ncbi:MAG: DUF3667 domain-containing protein [Flavobacteriaceae bacterium]|jgi:hypothetical protein|nr:DUF3667 domain-containing protein [Flavobacteriaceae bacterium]